jgi:hypothetical protein
MSQIGIPADCCGAPAFCERDECSQRRGYAEWCDYWDRLSPEDRREEYAAMDLYVAETKGIA